MSRFTLVVATILLPSAAIAHPDHASGNSGFVHFLTDPFHVGLTVAAVLLFAVTRRFVLRRQADRDRSARPDSR